MMTNISLLSLVRNVDASSGIYIFKVADPFSITEAITHIWSVVFLNAEFFPCTEKEFGRIAYFSKILLHKT